MQSRADFANEILTSAVNSNVTFDILPTGKDLYTITFIDDFPINSMELTKKEIMHHSGLKERFEEYIK